MLNKLRKNRQMKWLTAMVLALGGCFFLAACGSHPEEETVTAKKDPETAVSAAMQPAVFEMAELPEGIEWLTNNTDPVYASAAAEKGGMFRDALMNFPLTFRTVGPDSNLASGFRSAVSGNQYSLIGIHPNTLNIIPELATHWAYGKDKKTMYFKLNKKARWSDGHPVTAGDFAYTLEFMRSPHIISPWHNNYYTEEIEKIIIYDDHTLAVVARQPKPDLHLLLGISPTPRHFYGVLDADFVKKYNWKIVPNTGPYQILDFEKGKKVRFKRKKEWWGKDLKYYKNRFNVDMVVFEVVKDYNLQWEYFKKGKIDAFSLQDPKYWYEKADTPVVRDGYVEKIWFYNDTPRSSFGLWLNQKKEIFKDPNVRYAFAHAMNMDKVIQQVLRNDYVRMDQPWLGYGKYTNTTIKARTYDVGKVEAYMTQSGWKRGKDGIWVKNGTRFSVDVTYGFDDHTPKLAVLKEEAKKAGVELNLRLLDPTAWYKKLIEKKHDVSFGGFTAGLRPSYWQGWHSDNANKSNTNNITETADPVLDQLIEQYRNALAAKERIALSQKIQAKIHEIGAVVPAYMAPYIRQAFWRWWRLPEVPGTRLSSNLFSLFHSGSGGLCWFDQKRYDETQAAMKSGKTFDPVTIKDKTYLPKP